MTQQVTNVWRKGMQYKCATQRCWAVHTGGTQKNRFLTKRFTNYAVFVNYRF